MNTEIVGKMKVSNQFSTLDTGFIAHVCKAIRSKEVRLAAIKMNLKTESDTVDKYIKCNFSDDNLIADFDGQKLYYNEFIECPHRGKCPGEGIFCKIPGNLTPREMQFAVLTAEGFADCEIADKMQISIYTAKAHRRNIEQKLNFSSKLDIVRWVVMIAPNRFVKSIKL